LKSSRGKVGTVKFGKRGLAVEALGFLTATTTELRRSKGIEAVFLAAIDALGKALE
jgi:hypothetical protein